MADTVSASVLIVNIANLSRNLPVSLPKALSDDYIQHVLTAVKGDDEWETFNRRMDLLFAENLRGVDGYLPNIKGGRFGMRAVAKYLNGIDTEASWFLAAPAILKLERVNNELLKIRRDTIFWYGDLEINLQAFLSEWKPTTMRMPLIPSRRTRGLC